MHVFLVYVRTIHTALTMRPNYNILLPQCLPCLNFDRFHCLDLRNFRASQSRSSAMCPKILLLNFC